MKKHKLNRIFYADNIVQGAVIPLEQNHAHYLKNVMRRDVSDQLLIFNGNDGEWLVEISDITKKTCNVLALEQTRKPTQSPDVWLCSAPVKNAKPEYIVQKATELGISAFVPVITTRTVVNKVNEERLINSAIEAAEQCERLDVPEIHPLTKLEALLKDWPQNRKILLCDESGNGKTAKELLSHLLQGEAWAILIGPEGGFSPEEFALLREQPFVYAVSLGPRILRADTATIAALSCWQEHLGDWDIAPDFRQEKL
jgi:16S rRNA (uracil1498-N3)-methyltransferase